MAMTWECLSPGTWKCGVYTARRTNHRGDSWELRKGDESLNANVSSLEECKRHAQWEEDKANYKAPENYPVTTVRRVEVIDHRPHTAYRGRCYTARNVERTVLSFEDNNEVLKVVLT
jgi:hypothetical protein